MKTAISLLVLLFALPAFAESVNVTKDELTKAGWQGTLVVVMNGETTVMPVTFTFSADGKVKLESPHEKTETQLWSYDEKAKSITFKKLDGKVDVVLGDVAMSTGGPGGRYVSMTASFGPGDPNAKMPPGMSMKVYLSRLK